MKLPTNATYRRIGCKLRRGTAVAAMLALAAPLTAYALPKGGTVVEGSAQIIQLSPTKLEVLQKSPNTEIDWQSFDIAKGQTVIFIQGGVKNQALNEIQGGQTVIDGKLIADGTLILINAHGILFGADARAEVARLIASTANVSFADLAAGRLNFSIPGVAGATVGNAGEITARQGGLVAFIAPNVVNSGIINARLGKVALAGGDAATLDLYGDGLISIVLGGTSQSATIRQSGKIFAAGGTVQLTASQAKSLVESVINLDGVVRADSVSQQDGTIVLEAGNVNVAGEVAAEGAAPGTAGGTVKLLGDHIQLASTATVSASGQAGGGAVLVGGNDQGNGPEPDATTVIADAGSQIRADATSQGNGGRVILWSNQSTVAHGTVSTVGAGGGSGGFIETSSGGQLVVDGTVNSGAGGQWLLDPDNITIGSTDQNSLNSCAVSCTVMPTADDSVVSAQTIDNDLNANSEVTVKTTGGGTQPGDITVASAIDKSAGGDSLLVLQADHSVIVNADISSTTGKLGVDLISGTNGNVTLNGNFTLNGGQFDATGPTVVQQSTIDSGGGNIFFHNTVDGPGNLSLKAGAGDITFSGVVGGAVTLGLIDVQSAQSADFQAAVITQQFTQEAGNQLHFQGNLSAIAANNTDAVNVTANDILLDPGTVLSTNGNVKVALGDTSDLNLSAGTNGNNPAKIEVANGSFTQTGAGAVFLGGPVTTQGGAIIFNGFVLVTNPNGTSVCSTGPACDTNFSTGDVTFTNTLDTDSMVTAHYNLTISAAQFLNLNQVGTSNPINNLTLSADSIASSQVDAVGKLVMAVAGVNTPPGLGAAIEGGFDAQSIVVGSRDITAVLPPIGLSGTIAGKEPTGPSDTSHLPSLAANTVVGTGPYTLDYVCFAACGTSGGGGGNNGGGGGGGYPGGISIAGLDRAQASVLIELQNALTTAEQQEIQTVLAALPADQVASVLDQLEAATPEQRQALLDQLKTVDIAKLVQDNSLGTLIADAGSALAQLKSGTISLTSLLSTAGPTVSGQTYKIQSIDVAPTTYSADTIATTPNASTQLQLQVNQVLSTIDPIPAATVVATLQSVVTIPAGIPPALITAVVQYVQQLSPADAVSLAQTLTSKDTLAQLNAFTGLTYYLTAHPYPGYHPQDALSLLGLKPMLSALLGSDTDTVTLLQDAGTLHQEGFSAADIAALIPVMKANNDTPSDVANLYQSYEQAFGRPPSAAEAKYWLPLQGKYHYSEQTLYNANVSYLSQDSNTQLATFDAAFKSAFGHTPSSQETADYYPSATIIFGFNGYSAMPYDQLVSVLKGLPAPSTPVAAAPTVNKYSLESLSSSPSVSNTDTSKALTALETSATPDIVTQVQKYLPAAGVTLSNQAVTLLVNYFKSLPDANKTAMVQDVAAGDYKSAGGELNLNLTTGLGLVSSANPPLSSGDMTTLMGLMNPSSATVQGLMSTLTNPNVIAALTPAPAPAPVVVAKPAPVVVNSTPIITAAFKDVYGRAPTSQELSQYAGTTDKNSLEAKLQTQLGQETLAYLTPPASAPKNWQPAKLSTTTNDQEKVIASAFQTVLKRNPTTQELGDLMELQVSGLAGPVTGITYSNMVTYLQTTPLVD